MEFEAWHSWDGPAVAAFVSAFCGLPQYAPALRRNLTGAALQQLAASGMLSKGLSRAGIHDFTHQRQIAGAVAKLVQMDPRELAEEMRARLRAEDSRKPPSSRPTAPSTPRPPTGSRRPPGIVVPILQGFPTHLPPAGVRHNRLAEEEHSERTRYTPRPWSDDPADGQPSPLDEAELRSVRKFRGRVASSRDEYNEMLEQVPAVASVRGLQQLQAQREKQELLETRAAVRIQAVHRGNRARHDVDALRLEHAVRSQQTGRSLAVDCSGAEAAVASPAMAAQRDLEEAAAMRIQAARRGHLARRGVTDMLLEQEEEHRREAAAVRIQAQLRGNAVRRAHSDAAIARADAEQQHAAAVKIQALHRGNQARRRLLPNVPEDAPLPDVPEDTAIEAGTAPQLHGLSLDDTEEEQAAAVRMQALARGHRARLSVQTMRVEMMEQERERAAIKIQAAYRGGLVRSNLQGEGGTQEEHAAAMRLQAYMRGNQARREVDAMRLQMAEENAAVRIQAAYRGSQVRRDLYELQGLPDEAGLDGSEEEHAAAVKLQAFVRGQQARREVEAMLVQQEEQEMEDAAMKIQACFRGNLVRRQLDAMYYEQEGPEELYYEEGPGDAVAAHYPGDQETTAAAYYQEGAEGAEEMYYEEDEYGEEGEEEMYYEEGEEGEEHFAP